MTDTLLQFVYTLIGVILASAYGLTAAGIVAVVLARVQGRVGPPVYQPFLNLGRATFVRTAISHGPMFYFGPIIRATGGIGVFVFIPVIYGWGPGMNFSNSGDLLLVMYFIFFGSLGMALGASNGGQPNSPIGISRGLAQMAAFELPFNLAVVAIVAHAGTFQINDIVAAQQGSILNWNVFQHPFATLAAIIAMLGMNMYPPFNIVGAPNEIPVGPRTEYHGGFISTLQIGVSTFVIAKTILYVNLFFGGTPAGLHPLLAVLLMAAKVLAVYLISVFVGAVFPRFRADQSIAFFIRWPALLGVVSIALALV